jgi:hypothetical protein
VLDLQYVKSSRFRRGFIGSFYLPPVTSVDKQLMTMNYQVGAVSVSLSVLWLDDSCSILLHYSVFCVI